MCRASLEAGHIDVKNLCDSFLCVAKLSIVIRCFLLVPYVLDAASEAAASEAAASEAAASLAHSTLPSCLNRSMGIQLARQEGAQLQQVLVKRCTLL